MLKAKLKKILLFIVVTSPVFFLAGIVFVKIEYVSDKIFLTKDFFIQPYEFPSVFGLFLMAGYWLILALIFLLTCLFKFMKKKWSYTIIGFSGILLCGLVIEAVTIFNYSQSGANIPTGAMNFLFFVGLIFIGIGGRGLYKNIRNRKNFETRP